ncbi:MAG: L,D-transpeptidase [Candidatus Moraniibacteriota bacterium]|nr:MAG: L,D-transpeptidase [Candidatus Moranbacteria bacterium]
MRPALESGLTDVRPDAALRVHFTSPVKTTEYTERIRISPQVPVLFEWEEKNATLRILPEKQWESGNEYTLSLPPGQTVWMGEIPETIFHFRVWEPPMVTSVSPRDGEKDVLMGAEDPIVVTLSRPASDTFFEFSVNGERALLYETDPERAEFRLLPKNLESGKRYQLSVRARHREASARTFTTLYRGSFETMPPAPSEWAKDFPTRLTQAKRYTTPLFSTGKYIDINLSSQVMVLFEEGQALDSFLVSSGKRGMDTPKGEFSIHNKALRPWSKAYSLYMPYWMAITSDGKFGLHELPEWPGGYKEGANHLGTPVSHGCVRLGVGNAKRVYEWADVGTRVVIR